MMINHTKSKQLQILDFFDCIGFASLLCLTPPFPFLVQLYVSPPPYLLTGGDLWLPLLPFLPLVGHGPGHPAVQTNILRNIYHLIALCTKYVRLQLTDMKICRKFQHDTDSGKSTKIYTRKVLVMMETSISNFQTSFLSQKSRSWRFTFHI